MIMASTELITKNRKQKNKNGKLIMIPDQRAEYRGSRIESIEKLRKTECTE